MISNNIFTSDIISGYYFHADGNVDVDGNLKVDGDFTVNGTTSTVNSITLTVDDKNIELGSVDTPTNVTADGGGITLKGATDKEFKWTNASNSWNSSENLGIADGKYLFTDKVRARDGAGLSLKDDGGNGIFIKDGGNVGIGTTSPASHLHVVGQGYFTRSSSTSAPLYAKQDGTGPSAYFMGGNVGIGTTSPTQKLSVDGNLLLSKTDIDGGNEALLFNSGGSADHPLLRIYDKDGDTGAAITANGNSYLSAKGGNVGIGTTSPDSRLHISQPGTTIGGNDLTKGCILLGSSTEGVAIDNNEIIKKGPANDSDFVIGNANSAGRILLRTNEANRVVISNSSTAISGNLSVSGDLTVTGKTITNDVEVVSTSNGVVFEGSATDNNEGLLKAGTLTADRTYTLPNKSGTVAMTTDIPTIPTISNSTITITAGGALTGGGSFTLNGSGGTITLNHQDTSSQGSSNNSGRTYIQDIGLDAYGHVTSIGTATETVVPITYSAGSGLVLSGTTFSHQDTSSQGSSNNSGRTYIQDIGLDAYGHVTSIGTATETVDPVTYSAGNHLTLTDTTFSVNRDLRGATNPATGVYAIGQNNQSYFMIHGIIPQKADTYLGGTHVSRLEEDGDLHIEGDVLAFSTTVSDKKFKNNINQIKSGLEKVKKLRGVEFDWNATSRKGTRDIGVIAQEVEEVIPEVVREKVPCVGEFCENTEKYKTVDYSKLVPVLIEAIKDLSEEVEELKKKLS